MLTVAVALAAGLGAVCRYLLDELVGRRTSGPFPYGTLAVNVSGSLLLGLAVGLGGHVATVVGAGFAGGYTTLSTWAWETLALAAGGTRAARKAAVVNVVGSVALGLTAGAAGLGLARL